MKAKKPTAKKREQARTELIARGDRLRFLEALAEVLCAAEDRVDSERNYLVMEFDLPETDKEDMIDRLGELLD